MIGARRRLGHDRGRDEIREIGGFCAQRSESWGSKGCFAEHAQGPFPEHGTHCSCIGRS